MKYDESNARLTQELTGRTVEHLERRGKEIDIITTCGHVVTIQADINGDIHYNKTGVRIILPSLDIGSELGQL